MNLPVQIRLGTPAEPVIRVDGASGPSAGSLDLSHWPGHDTPLALRHDLSTGCALRFAALEERARRQLAGDAVAIVNNHYDTDGCLALFAVRHPAAALLRAEALLRAARAGDFFAPPDDEAFKLDALVDGLADPERSPLREHLASTSDVERWQLCADHLLEHLPAIVDGDVAAYRDLWEPGLDRHHADRSALEDARRADTNALDLTSWTSEDPDFAPGRHALFGSTNADRVMTITARDGGHLVRLVLSTRSWFDLVTETRLPRPDLVRLAARLDELEGTNPALECAWRAQPLRNASPELWFGRAEVARFAPRNDALVPSGLDPQVVRTEIERFLS